MPARRDALHEQWNEDLQAFTCKYTCIALTHNGGARNAEWEHVIPGVECGYLRTNPMSEGICPG